MTLAADTPPGALLEDLPAVDLTGVQAVADLQRRFDRKYLVERGRVGELLDALPGDRRVLEVAGRRATPYTSVYFDTEDRRTYRDHVMRRRRRFKVRTRHYGDGSVAMLEVKCKGRRGQTIKHRWPHPAPDPGVLDDTALGLVETALQDHYGFGAPIDLGRSAVIRFQRVTLLLPSAGERVTIDLDLTVAANGHELALGRRHAVVETKEPVRRGQASLALTGLGLRPDRLSKYCVGVTATDPALRGNAWRPALRVLGEA